jgi:environmental stress-induced protein Ves
MTDTASHPDVVRIAACAPTRWANGRGVTRVLATGRFPGSTADVDWRLSVAELTEDGAFSLLPGRDRIFVALGGPGLTLTIDNDRVAVNPLVPLHFSGDAPVYCHINSSTVALNVMTRRMACIADVHIHTGPGLVQCPPDAISYLVALTGTSVVQRSERAQLNRCDMLPMGTDVDVRASDDSRVAVIRVRRR